MTGRNTPAGEVIVLTRGDRLAGSRTEHLVKTSLVEVVRHVIPAGTETIPMHPPGELTVQCLEGRVEFAWEGAPPRTLRPGEMVFVHMGQSLAIKALEDSSLLFTKVLITKRLVPLGPT